MKELTIEQKAQRYDEAIEAARCIYNNMKEGYNFGGMEDLEVIFSELKESENKNEKIRKAIGYAIGQSTHSDGTLINGVSSEEALAWLEEQAEQNTTIEQKPTWSEEDERMLNHIIKLLDGLTNLHNWLKSLKCRVQPKVEWNEEDVAMYQGVIETEQYMLDVVHGRKIFDVGNVSIMGECAKELTWLNSRFKKLLEQLKQL